MGSGRLVGDEKAGISYCQRDEISILIVGWITANDSHEVVGVVHAGILHDQATLPYDEPERKRRRNELLVLICRSR